MTDGPSLAERLGFAADDRVVIVNCDDLGSSHAANEAIDGLVGSGAATSTTLMVPCPWARPGAEALRGRDVGVHLTLTSEWEGYRWRPVTSAPTLRDDEGCLPRTIEAVWATADLDDVRTELRAQIDLALAWGVDVTHLDSHMGTLQLDERYTTIYRELAVEHDLPLRLSGRSTEALIGYPFRDAADAAGVLAPDHLLVGDGNVMVDALADLRPGVTEIFFHPAADHPELRAQMPDPDGRIADAARLAPGGPVDRLLATAGAHRISYRLLRDLQRRDRSTTS